MYVTTKINPTGKKGGNNAVQLQKTVVQLTGGPFSPLEPWATLICEHLHMCAQNGTVKTGKEDGWKTVGVLTLHVPFLLSYI